ncbi:hypothetical protein TNCT_98261 [Trichonephila clavata]|uniref:Uncharacterized protein n=1 Tax=Trichonephila clavata TaxID=2740835 RepID=A0A8X6FPA9_TRICU|nr:hypothetical protein TNCT_98261 [Trichonephila clavata]
MLSHHNQTFWKITEYRKSHCATFCSLSIRSRQHIRKHVRFEANANLRQIDDSQSRLSTPNMLDRSVIISALVLCPGQNERLWVSYMCLHCRGSSSIVEV